MKFKLISCNVFKREIEYAAARTKHECEIEFLELGEHARPSKLREMLQQRIDAAEGCDAVLLGYGLCGRATDGLAARNRPVVLPRSHDCCGILLGSRKRFEELFRDMPSTPFSSVGFVAHGDYYFSDGEMMIGDSYAALVDQYGEDDAKYIYEAMHPKLEGEYQPLYFISMTEIPCGEAREACRAKVVEEGRGFIDIEGNIRLISKLLSGDWPDEEFLVVKPGQRISMVGDWDRIIKAE